MAPSTAGLLSSFLAAIQASLSVLLVISYGILAAYLRLLDNKSGKAISKVCVKLFLPALLLTKIGSELHAGSAHRYLIILIWAFVCHILSFLIGYAAHLLFRFPDWITAAIMFNNTTSYPLLLIQSLDETGILSGLIVGDETTRAAIERAKSYFLVFATVSSCLTFAVGPRLIDTEHAPDPPIEDKDVPLPAEAEGDQAPHPTGSLTNGTHGPNSNNDNEHDPEAHGADSATEHTSLLHLRDTIAYERRAYGISASRWLSLHPRTRWILLFAYDFLNTPLLGAILGTIIGLVPVLHTAFFSPTEDGGIFTAWLTVSLQNVGQLFVPLPVVIAGVSLWNSMGKSKPGAETGTVEAGTPWAETGFVLFVRFVLWPVMSIAVIWALVKQTNLLGNDPILWFTLMLMPTGPPAMKLIAMVQVSDGGEAEETKIAKLLTIAYAVSPILAFTVVGSLRASQAGIGT